MDTKTKHHHSISKIQWHKPPLNILFCVDYFIKSKYNSISESNSKFLSTNQLLTFDINLYIFHSFIFQHHITTVLRYCVQVVILIVLSQPQVPRNQYHFIYNTAFLFKCDLRNFFCTSTQTSILVHSQTIVLLPE